MTLAAGTPGRKASAPLMGLLPAAKAAGALITADERQWGAGIFYETEACVTPGTPRDICAPGAFEAALEPTTSEWTPYIVSADWACSTFSHRPGPEEMNEHYAAARRRLMATWQWQMERELWTGELAQAKSYPNRWLADSATADPLTAAGVTPIQALSCLTAYLAGNSGGQQGMIHATPQLVTYWVENGLLEKQGPVLYTIARGDIVVPGSGYDGSSPDGEPATDGHVWAYATDIVEVREGAIDPGGISGSASKPVEWVDPTNNRIVIRSQKRVLASWEGCRLASAEVNINVCFAGS